MEDVTDIQAFPLSVATTTGTPTIAYCCTKKGYICLPLIDGDTYCQLCYYCSNATETIISPEAIVASSLIFTSWHQEGHRGSKTGSIIFTSDYGSTSMEIKLTKCDGLYYCYPPSIDPHLDPGNRARATALVRKTRQYLPATRD
jgi:hypothetical protein